MVALPTAADIAAPIPQPDGKPVQYPRQFGGPGVIGEAVSQAGRQVENIQNQADEFDYAKATSQLLTQDTNLRSSVQDDPNWQNAQKTYQDGITQARQSAAASISNPMFLAKFNEVADQTIAQGNSALNKYVREKSNGQVQADTLSGSETNMQGALADPGNSHGYISATNSLVDGAVAKGAYTPAEGFTLKKNFAQNYGDGFAKMQSPQRQYDLLKQSLTQDANGGFVKTGTPVDFIDAEKRAQMLREITPLAQGAQLAPLADEAVRTSATGAASAANISDAIFGQESGYGANSQTSDKGAVGPSQIKPETAILNGLDPSRLSDPAYATQARNTIIANLQKDPNIGNDPARIAVGYFSGPGNVAPPGSSTPWKVDRSDGHTLTSQYVSGVLSKMKPAAPANDDAASQAAPPGQMAPPSQGVSPPSSPQTPQQTADYYRSNYAPILDNARAIAERTNPGDAAFSDRLVARTEQKMNDYIRQQDLYVKSAKDTIYQALDGVLTKGHLPTSVDEMLSTSPAVRSAWATVQANDPPSALAIETHLNTANSKGKAANYGNQFYQNLQAVLAPTNDPSYIHDTAKLLPSITPGENGPLTNTGFSQLNAFEKMRGTPQGEAFAAQTRTFLEQMHGLISGSNRSTGVLDHVGDSKFDQYLQTALPSIQAGLNAGKTAAQMYDPKSPDYIGTQAMQFSRPVNERVKNMLDDAMVQNSYGPKPLDPQTASAIDAAVKGGQFTAAQGSGVKNIMQQYHDKKLTLSQAKQQLIQLVPGLAPPPDVPRPNEQ